jgi:hypothetical protein
MEESLKLRTSDYLMTVRTPLARGSRGGLWFVVEHKAKRTRAGYEVQRGTKTAQFVNLEDAIKYYNGG